jgi:hypothetical protein
VNFLPRLAVWLFAVMLKSNLIRIIAHNTGVQVEQAGIDLERIVAQSLRQASPGEAPLMAWPVVCGSAVAERTQALSFADGVLRVAVPDTGWRSELQTLAPRYLASINRYTLQPVRRIEFVVTRRENPPDNSL